jgi:predicted DsbA family dithiol-disulfide isomerase
VTVPEAIRFHFDPLCPWCWQTSRWVRDLAGAGVVTVEWALFSLALANHDGDEPLDPDTARGVRALRTAVAVRDTTGSDGLGAFYAALGHLVFDQVRSVNDDDTIDQALGAVGLGPEVRAGALGDPGTWERLQAEHATLVSDTRSFGVPTIRLDGGSGPAIFGPVITDPPDDPAEAEELWRHVSWLVRYENFTELKRERTADPDLASYRAYRRRTSGG